MLMFDFHVRSGSVCTYARQCIKISFCNTSEINICERSCHFTMRTSSQVHKSSAVDVYHLALSHKTCAKLFRTLSNRLSFLFSCCLAFSAVIYFFSSKTKCFLLNNKLLIRRLRDGERKKEKRSKSAAGHFLFFAIS